MVEFWKRIFTGHKIQNTSPTQKEVNEVVLKETDGELETDSQSILFWIDTDSPDLIGRLIRFLGLAEAFQRLNSASVSIACPNRGKFLEEIHEREMNWIDSVSDDSLSILKTIVEEKRPDIVIADCINLLTADFIRNFCQQSTVILYSDHFEETLFEVDVVLLPGFIDTPDFDEISCPPSALGKCIHGEDCVPLPDSYTKAANNASAETKNKVLFAISDNAALEEIQTVLKEIDDLTGVCLFHSNVSPSVLEQIKEQWPDLELQSGDDSIESRLKALSEASIVLAFPALHLYECLALGKTVFLLPRTEGEQKFCRHFENHGAVLVCSLKQIDQIKEEINELQQNESLIDKINTEARKLVPPDGAERIIGKLNHLVKEHL